MLSSNKYLWFLYFRTAHCRDVSSKRSKWDRECLHCFFLVLPQGAGALNCPLLLICHCVSNYMYFLRYAKYMHWICSNGIGGLFILFIFFMYMIKITWQFIIYFSEIIFLHIYHFLLKKKPSGFMLKAVTVESLHYILTAQLKYLSQLKPRNLPYQRKPRPCWQRARAWPEPISSALTAKVGQWQQLIKNLIF